MIKTTVIILLMIVAIGISGAISCQMQIRACDIRISVLEVESKGNANGQDENYRKLITEQNIQSVIHRGMNVWTTRFLSTAAASLILLFAILAMKTFRDSR